MDEDWLYMPIKQPIIVITAKYITGSVQSSLTFNLSFNLKNTIERPHSNYKLKLENWLIFMNLQIKNS